MKKLIFTFILKRKGPLIYKAASHLVDLSPVERCIFTSSKKLPLNGDRTQRPAVYHGLLSGLRL